MRRLSLLFLVAVCAAAQVVNLPNTYYPTFRNLINNNFSWLNAHKAGIGDCKLPGQFIISTTSTGVVCASSTTGILANTSQVVEFGNLYFTNARVLDAMRGLYQPPITTGNPNQYIRGDLTLALFPTKMEPLLHAASHRNGGDDEIATLIPAPNAIPKADEGGLLAAGWFPILNQSTTGSAASLLDQYIDWLAVSGGASIKNKPSIPTITGNVPLKGSGGNAIPALYSDLVALWTNCTGFLKYDGTCSALSGGDTSSNTSASVDSEIALFSGTTGKLLKRATGTGYVKVLSGVISVQATVPAADLPAALSSSTSVNGTPIPAGASLAVTAANTFSGLQDLSATTMKPPRSPGYAPTAAGLFGIDSTSGMLVWGTGAATNRSAWWTGADPASGNCVKWGPNGQLQDQGASCGTGGGSGMTYPGAGIGVSNGVSWLTSLQAPTGALVGTTDVQALTNKTVNGVAPTVFAYLDLTSSAQTQLNGKLSNPMTTLGDVIVGGAAGAALRAACTSGVLKGGSPPACSALAAVDIPTALANTTSVNGTSIPSSATLMTTVTALVAGQMPALTGDVTNTAGTFAMTVARINGVALSGLGTGLLKNTTGTGAPSIAVAADLPAHAARHQNGGNDEIATSTPAANSIPKTGAGTTLAAGWIPVLNQNTTGTAAGLTVAYIDWAAASGGAMILNKPVVGDASTNTAASVDSEIALFSSTTGKMIKRATGTGYVRVSNGVMQTPAAIPPSDIPAALSSTTSVNGTSIPSGATLMTTVTSLLGAQMPALTGDVTSTAGTLATTVARINGVLLSGLGTGLIKNTTGTGVPSIAGAADLPAHASRHQNGGNDEIATSTPTANSIPKTGAGITLAAGWIPLLNQNTTGTAGGLNAAYIDWNALSGGSMILNKPTIGTAANNIPQFDSNGLLPVPGGLLSGNGLLAGEVQMAELAANGPNYISLMVPDSITTTLRLKFPDALPGGSFLGFGTPSSNISLGAWVSYSTTPAPNTVPVSGAGGTLSSGWLPAPAAAALGGVVSGQCTTGTGKLMGYDTSGARICETDITGGAGTDLNAATGDINTAQIEDAAVTSAKLAASLKVRSCEVHIWGTGASSVLQDADDEPESCRNKYTTPWTITAVDCYSNTGTPTVMVTNGSVSSHNVLSGNLSCGANSWAAGSLTATGADKIVAVDGTLGINVVVAGGAATNIRIVVTGTI